MFKYRYIIYCTDKIHPHTIRWLLVTVFNLSAYRTDAPRRSGPTIGKHNARTYGSNVLHPTS